MTPVCAGISLSDELPLLAESGSQNFVFPAILMSALPPEAYVQTAENGMKIGSAFGQVVFPRFSGQLSLVLMSVFRTRPD